MRKAFVLLVLLTAVGGCVSVSPSSEAGAPRGGVTGATIKRAAVHDPDTIDFGGDVETVEAYDLDASTAGMSKTFGSADVERDQEIEEILDTIGQDTKPESAKAPSTHSRPAARPTAAPPARLPAVPPLPTGSGSAATAIGVTASTAPPPVSTPSLAAQAQTLTARQERIFPKPLWRRVHEAKTARDPSRALMSRGF